MNNIGVSLSFNKNVYVAGNLVSGLLRFQSATCNTDCSPQKHSGDETDKKTVLDEFDPNIDSFVVTIQASGNICIDSKWTKISKLENYFDHSSVNHLIDSGIARKETETRKRQLQTNTSNNAIRYLYVSSTESYSFNKSNPIDNIEPIIIQFNLPLDALPSHKGLSFSISYGIHVFVTSSKFGNQRFMFNFPVISNNTSHMVSIPTPMPYRSKSSSLTLMTLSAISSINGGLCLPNDMSECRRSSFVEHTMYNQPSNIYNITDKEFVCSLELDVSQIMSGNKIVAQMYFGQSKQSCAIVSAGVIQSEIRSDGSIIQVSPFIVNIMFEYY
jgi:hypothetical protein